MEPDVAGGCQCGAVRYQSSAGPLYGLHCYCRRCQQTTGAGHASSFAVPVEAVVISGNPGTFTSGSDAGNAVTGGFCGTCGSSVFSKSAGYPDVIYFHAGTLDDPSVFEAGMAVFQSHRQPWDSIDPKLASQR